MKNIFWILILISFQSYSQNEQWYEFELENIRIDFPTEDVYQLDTIIKGVRLNQLYSQIGNSTLILQKLPAQDNTKDGNLSSLPYDHKSLIEYYNGVVDGAKDSSKSEKVEKEEITLGELIGYKSVIYNNIDKPLIKSITFLAGNDLIMASVYNPETEMNEINNTFFNSLNLDKIDSLEQYTGKSKAYKQGYVFGKLFFFVLLGVGIFFLIRALRKKK